MDWVFSTLIYGPGVKQEGHELKWKKTRCCTLLYRPDPKNEVSKMFMIISVGN